MARDFLQAPLVKGDPVRKEITSTDIGTTKRALDTYIANTTPIPVDISGAAADTTPTIFNVACPIANQEYSQALPANCREFVFKARNQSKVKFAYVTGFTSYLTIEAGVSFKDTNRYVGATIYFKCSKADEVVEIVAYV